MKIAYVFSTLAKTGGTERMIAEKANYLAERFSYDVTIINCFQRDDEANRFPVSEKVKQINIGIPYYSQYKYKYPKRLWIKRQLNNQVRKSISHYVRLVDPDILIGISFFNANLVSSVRCRAKIIIESHEARLLTMSSYNGKHSFLTRLYLKVFKYFYFRTTERNADVVVTLTEDDKKLWKRTKHIEVIPNFSAMPISNFTSCTSQRIIAVGRLEWEKGYVRLIEIWRIVSARHPDWHLDVFGEGSMHDTLEALIDSHNVKNFTLHKATSDISQEYANSSICVVTSYFESFSLVLLEALRHGVPCVAFDCPFGPRNIINDAYDGFLVVNDSTRLFAERICRLIEDEELRKQFSERAIEKAKAFDVDVIMNKCAVLYQQLLND